MDNNLTFDIKGDERSGFRQARLSLSRSESAAINGEMEISINSGIMNKADIAEALDAIAVQLRRESLKEQSSDHIDRFFAAKKAKMKNR